MEFSNSALMLTLNLIEKKIDSDLSKVDMTSYYVGKKDPSPRYFETRNKTNRNFESLN